jgi:hypothetical protein
MENKIKNSIPDQVITDVATKIAEASNLLKPYLIALTPTERKEIPKMSDGSLPFVQKCLDYCSSNPEFAPKFTNFNELKDDMKVYEQLLPIFRAVVQLEDKLNDTTMQAGAESYVASLSYYNSVKYAAKMNAPGAKAIAEDLSKRFAKAKPATPAPESN